MPHHARDQLLHRAHHHLVVGVGLVKLEHGELGVVGAVHPLVPEVVPDLVDPLEAADQQPLEVQLVGDPQVERHVQRLVVGDEGARRRPAVLGLQDGSLHLQEPALVQKAAQVRDRPRPHPEHLPDLGMDRQVGVALPVADLGIGQPAVGGDPALGDLRLPPGERPERLRQDLEALHPHRDLAHPGPEQPAPNAEVVVQVQELHQAVAVSQDVAAEVHLQPAGRVLQVGERGLALRAERDHPPGDRHLGPLLPHRVVVGGQRLGGRVAPVEPVGEGRHAQPLELRPLLAPRRLDVAPLVGRAHAALLPKRLR